MASSEYCSVPVAGRITIDADGRQVSKYEYGTIPAKDFADLLIRGFGIDVEDLFVRGDADPAA